MRHRLEERSFKLRDKHGWKARPGYNICAINRGAIRFDYPDGWDVSADTGSLKIRDRPEPDDNCVLAVSQMHLPREAADLAPIRDLVEFAAKSDTRQVLERNEVEATSREDGVELATVKLRFVDPNEKRDAFSRLCKPAAMGSTA